MTKLGQWHKDNMGDYVIEIESTPMVRGRIVRCPIVTRFSTRFWRTKSRWLLLVNDNQYGFWKTMRQAMDKFEKDCVPIDKPIDDYDGEYYCWHGDKPYGPGPYCTGCGGLIKKK
jgi:hypothetical protein